MVQKKLDEIVREYLIENGHSEHKYFRALQLGISCLRDLNLDISGIPVSVVLNVNDNDTVDLPSDFVSLITLNLVDSNGHLHRLGQNTKLALPRSTDECGNPEVGSTTVEVVDVTYPSNTSYYADHYRNGENLGRNFGLGGGYNSNGYFRIDEVNGSILLNNYQGGSTIVLEYLSDISRSDGSYMVHPYIFETVKSYIDWKMIHNNQNLPQIAKQERERIYFQNKRNSRARYASADIWSWLAASRRGNKLSPKF